MRLVSSWLATIARSFVPQDDETEQNDQAALREAADGGRFDAVHRIQPLLHLQVPVTSGRGERATAGVQNHADGPADDLALVGQSHRFASRVAADRILA